jgi:integrase
MPTDPTEAASPTKLALLVMAGLPTPANVKTNQGQIVSFLWKMKTDNYSEETIERYGRNLETLIKRGAALEQPESVKDTIARQNWSNGTKQSVTNAVQLYWKQNGIEAKLPEYKPEAKIPFIPTEAELDQLISGCKHRLATFLQVLKETAARYGEAYKLKWTDYNTENGTLSITPEKGSAPRCPRISTKLQAMLSTVPRTSNRIFDYKSKDVIRKNYQTARKRKTPNLGNPRIQQIHFHTFRHWKATQEFHKTNNVILVMKLLGHKCLNNTQRYIQLLPDLSDDYVADVAHNTKEAVKLIEAGYTFVQTIGDEHIYKKRK